MDLRNKFKTDIFMPPLDQESRVAVLRVRNLSSNNCRLIRIKINLYLNGTPPKIGSFLRCNTAISLQRET